MFVCSLWEKDMVGKMNDCNIVNVVLGKREYIVVGDKIIIIFVNMVLFYLVGFENDGLRKCYNVVVDSKKIILIDCLYLDFF